MKGIWVLVILTLVLLAGLLFLNKYYDPIKDKQKFNVSVSTEYNNKMIKTGIEIDGNIINTSNSYELIEVNEGIIIIKNINIEDQNFYEKDFEFNVSSNSRIDIVLEKADLPDIKIKDNGTITLVLESDNFQDVDFCIKGSYTYMFIKAKNFEEIRKLDGYENYDVCYDGNFSLDGNKKEIQITYTPFSQPTEIDYMNITLIDYAGNTLTKTIK